MGWAEIPQFSSDAVRALEAYPWPGNVRELKNVVESSFIDTPDRNLEFIQLPNNLKRKIEKPLTFAQTEREKMLAVLAETKWNKSKASEKLNWSRMTLYRKMKKYKIDEITHLA